MLLSALAGIPLYCRSVKYVVDMDADVLSFGFYSGQRSFWSFDVSVRADVQTNLARDLFVSWTLLLSFCRLTNSSRTFVLDCLSRWEDPKKSSLEFNRQPVVGRLNFFREELLQLGVGVDLVR